MCSFFPFLFMSTGMVISFATKSSSFAIFTFLMWSLLLMPHPLIGPFIFRDLGYLYWLVVPGQVPLCRAHIALQELQAVAIMLHRMAFCLSGKVVVLHLDNSTARAYLCNHGTVSHFLSRLACQIQSLTTKHGITLLPAFIPTQLNVEADYLSWDWMLPEWHLLPQVAFAFGSFQRWTCWHLLILLNASIISLWKLHCLWGPWG